MKVQVTDDVVADATAFLVERLRGALEGGRRASIALSGGRTPWAVFARLADVDLAWERVDVYQVDERVAPFGDPRRNLTQLLESLLDRVPARRHSMPVGECSLDADAAVARYADSLPDEFDVVHLGLGTDGHTASLVPGDPVLGVADRDVAVTEPYQGTRRMTLTYPVLDRARELLWVVSGEEKRAALEALIAGDPSIPAGRVRRDRAVVITDIRR